MPDNLHLKITLKLKKRFVQTQILPSAMLPDMSMTKSDFTLSTISSNLTVRFYHSPKTTFSGLGTIWTKKTPKVCKWTTLKNSLSLTTMYILKKPKTSIFKNHLIMNVRCSLNLTIVWKEFRVIKAYTHQKKPSYNPTTSKQEIYGKSLFSNLIRQGYSKRTNTSSVSKGQKWSQSVRVQLSLYTNTRT